MKPKVIVVTGATASGKSQFVYEHLRALPLTVINADSRQVYTDLPVSSASPSAEEKSLFEHRLYNFLPIDAVFSAGQFMRSAKKRHRRKYEGGQSTAGLRRYLFLSAGAVCWVVARDADQRHGEARSRGDAP
jgi:tRNA A37 N6-isopentenylltransferase MiaA